MDDLLTLWINSEKDETSLLSEFESEVKSLQQIPLLKRTRKASPNEAENTCEG